MITYRAINTLNGKFYIGSTNNFEKRKTQHLRDKRTHTPFHNALRKNPEVFEWEWVEDNSEEPVLEQALLDRYFGTEQCYNLVPEAGRPPSWEGRKQSEEHKRKRAQALTGRQFSPEHCENISRGKKGNNGFPDGIPTEIIAKRAAARRANGKKWTEEQKQALSEKKKGLLRWVNETGTIVYRKECPGPGWKRGKK